MPASSVQPKACPFPIIVLRGSGVMELIQPNARRVKMEQARSLLWRVWALQPIR